MALIDNNEAYYKCDTNGSLPDATGNGHTGSISGATYTASGKINGGYTLDGINDYLSLSSDALIPTNETTAFSVGFWMYNTKTLTSVVHQSTCYFKSSTQFIMYHYLSGSDEKFRAGWRGTAGVNGGIYYDIDHSADFEDQWVRVILTYNGSGSTTASNWNLYLNGSLYTTGKAYIYGGGGSGTTNRFGEGNFFEGTVDEISVWLRELSADDVTTDYNGGDGLQYPYTVAAEDNAILHGNNF